MKPTFLDWDRKHGRLHIGSCVIWAIAAVLIAFAPHTLYAVPLAVPNIWRWWRGG
jgi:hypothetical protein